MHYRLWASKWNWPTWAFSHRNCYVDWKKRENRRVWILQLGFHDLPENGALRRGGPWASIGDCVSLSKYLSECIFSEFQHRINNLCSSCSVYRLWEHNFWESGFGCGMRFRTVKQKKNDSEKVQNGIHKLSRLVFQIRIFRSAIKYTRNRQVITIFEYQLNHVILLLFTRKQRHASEASSSNVV